MPRRGNTSNPLRKPLITGRSGEQGSFEPTQKWKIVNGSMSNESNCGRLESALPKYAPQFEGRTWKALRTNTNYEVALRERL
jgi:hypothetical protein